MAFSTIHYQSRSLQKSSSFNIVFPEDANLPRPWATFYLLHGLSDDHTIWHRRTSIERYVTGLPLVVVMPDGGRGWYTNAREGAAHEDDLMKDILPLVERTFPVRAERAGRAIGGLSMGGYGAVKLALKYPEVFGSANSHSGALGFCRMRADDTRGISPEFTRIFGPDPKDGPEDPFSIITKMDHGRVPSLRIDCGTEDFLLGQNRAFHALLEGMKVDHEYQEFPGGHDWAYWDLHVQQAIAFHKKNLKLG